MKEILGTRLFNDGFLCKPFQVEILAISQLLKDGTYGVLFGDRITAMPSRRSFWLSDMLKDLRWIALEEQYVSSPKPRLLLYGSYITSSILVGQFIEELFSLSRLFQITLVYAGLTNLQEQSVS